MVDTDENMRDSNRDNIGSTSDSDTDSDDEDVAFASIDFGSVNFEEEPTTSSNILTENEKQILELENQILFHEAHQIPYEISNADNNIIPQEVSDLCNLIKNGQYAEILRSECAKEITSLLSNTTDSNLIEAIQENIQKYTSNLTDITKIFKVELIGVAAFNLFLQLNYTGPTIEKFEEKFSDILYPSFASVSDDNNGNQHNKILSQLAVDGEWPCQTCNAPYFLFMARVILSSLSEVEKPWTQSDAIEIKGSDIKNNFSEIIISLKLCKLWNARAIVAHQRLLQSTHRTSLTLWNECHAMFQSYIHQFTDNKTTNSDNNKDNDDIISDENAARIMLEWGLAQFHFLRPSKEIQASFKQSKEYSGVFIEVTGAQGKRTKFQQESKAQLLVRAYSKNQDRKKEQQEKEDVVVEEGKDEIKQKEESGEEKKDTDGLEDKSEMRPEEIKHNEEDGILLERVKFDSEEINTENLLQLNKLDQAILLAFCLDVKNENAMDGLTAEQMGGYLERVLSSDEVTDWMIYASGLLERAWLECERSHSRERAILQIQALVDQHTNRLTITQSTFDSVGKDSAPVQNRLCNLHTIVYPPRWSILRDLAERYAKLGIVTTAAEIYEEIELWDECVECYTHAGKQSKAEEIIRERLESQPTPRMWVALGDISKDKEHYEKAIELSQGRFSFAFVQLAKHYFEKKTKEDLEKSSDLLLKALEIKPLMPHNWFLLGVISMQIQKWDLALTAFSQVVQQEPGEGDGWANIAAIHMHNKDPEKAYPAICESIKQNRNNWKVWLSKLYTCLDLKKFDEAVQACNFLIDFRGRKNMEEKVPEIEEKCVRGIVGGVLKQYSEASDKIAQDSVRRSLERVEKLLHKIANSQPNKWIWNVRSHFDQLISGDQTKILENFMREYRSISKEDWVTNSQQIKKMCLVCMSISDIHISENTKKSLSQSRFLVNGVTKKIRAVYLTNENVPSCVTDLEAKLDQIDGAIKHLSDTTSLM